MAPNYTLTCSVAAVRWAFDLGGNIPESATASWPKDRLAITTTMATGDPKPLTVKPTTSIARVSAMLFDAADEMRRRRPADAIPITLIAIMTTVAAPVRMAPSVVVNVARDAAVTMRWIPAPRITMPR
jgi:hypothetical protein